MAIGLDETRWLMFEQGAGSVSRPMLTILVFWLAAIFISFGLFAPRNATVTAALFVSALSVSKARNDRAGGAMLIYTMLQNGLLVVADACKVIQESLESRIHDPDEPEKVVKVIGDPLDDAFDGFRYGVYSYQYPANKPLALRIAPVFTGGSYARRRGLL
jgi:hypothetical protein